MPDPFSDERASMSVDQHLVTVLTGDAIVLNRNDMYIRVPAGATTTAITTQQSADDQPYGLRFTLDNSEGSGLLTLNGSEVSVPAGEVYEIKVVGDGNGNDSKQFIVPAPPDTVNTFTTYSAIQAGIDNDTSTGKRIELPHGEISTTAAWDVDDGSGGGLYGQGMSDPVVAEDHASLHAHTTLRYTGTKVGTESLFTLQRSDWNLENVNLKGQTDTDIFNGTGTKTPRGISISRGASFGTGKLQLRRVVFAGFECAINCGGALADSNCDESSYYDLLSARNTTFFRSNNIQGLSHKFYNLRTVNTTTIFDYIAGGKLSVTDCFLGSTCTLLQLRNDQVSGWGPNSSTYEFRGVDLDNAAVNTKLVSCETPFGGYLAHVKFIGGNISPGTWTTSGIHVGNYMNVEVYGMTNIPPNFVTWDTTTNQSTVTFRGCKTMPAVTEAAQIFDQPNSTGNLRCIYDMGYQYDTYALLPVTPDSGFTYNQVLAGT